LSTPASKASAKSCWEMMEEGKHEARQAFEDRSGKKWCRRKRDELPAGAYQCHGTWPTGRSKSTPDATI
jgi:hypothetical protein